MKSHLHVSAFRFPLSAFLLLLLAAAPLHAQSWSNNGTDWGTGTNWTGGVVPNSTSANVTFNGTITNQPSIGASNYTITRLNVGSASSNVTLNGTTGNLTFTSTSNSTNNNNLITVAAGKSLTLSSGAGVTLDSALTGSQWTPNFNTGAGSVVEFASGSTLTSRIGSGNATSIAYQLQGNGTYNFNGAFVAGNSTSFTVRDSATLNWNPSSATTLSPNLSNSGTDGAQLNVYKSAGVLGFGSVGGPGNRTITIRADGLTFASPISSTTTMGNATGAGGSAFKNVLAIDDGTASAISVSLTNLSLTSNSSLGTNELFVGANDTMTFTGNITRTGGTTATTLTKSGAGTVVFSGSSNTYTDATVVSSGTLLLNNTSGSATGTGNLTVNAGARLGGTGIIASTGSNGVTLNNTAILAPGDGTTGTLRLNAASTSGAMLTMLSGAKFSMELGASLASDKVNFWTYAGASDFVRNSNVIDITFLSGSTTGNYTLFNFYSNNGTTLTAAGFSSGLSLNFTNGGSGTLDYSTLGQINLVVSAVPEPSTWALLAVSLTTVMVLRRRRRS
jgi:autotransporter-associated beta strand protein